MLSLALNIQSNPSSPLIHQDRFRYPIPNYTFHQNITPQPQLILTAFFFKWCTTNFPPGVLTTLLLLETVLYGCRFRRVTRWAIVDRSVVDIRTGTGGVKVLQR